MRCARTPRAPGTTTPCAVSWRAKITMVISTRAEAARALCAALPGPPSIAVCVEYQHGHHEHYHRAAAGALRVLADTGAIVEPVSYHANTSCGANNNLTAFDAVLNLRAGHIWSARMFWPYCFYRWRAPGFRLGTRELVPHHDARKQQQQQQYEEEEHDEYDASLVCPNATSSHHPRTQLRIAIGLGGLARTFSHPLVYKTLRGHVVDALAGRIGLRGTGGGASVCVLAALRLEDDRPVTAGGGPGMGATMGRAMHADVRRALNYLSVDDRDVLLRENATVGVPDCTQSTRDRNDTTPTSGKAHHPTPCASYNNACALPTVAGQVWSRRAVYDLVVARELRDGAMFDSILFMRPDVAVIIPLVPACLYLPHTLHQSTHYADWFAWLPRVDVDGAFRAVSDELMDFDASSHMHPQNVHAHVHAHVHVHAHAHCTCTCAHIPHPHILP